MNVTDDIGAVTERDAVVQAHRCGRRVPARQCHGVVYRCDLLMLKQNCNVDSACWSHSIFVRLLSDLFPGSSVLRDLLWTSF